MKLFLDWLVNYLTLLFGKKQRKREIEKESTIVYKPLLSSKDLKRIETVPSHKTRIKARNKRNRVKRSLKK